MFNKLFSSVLLCFFLLALAGCKIKITVPEGATVMTLSGRFQCTGGEMCVIDVVDTMFDETFTVVPPDGLAFAGWRKDDRFLCGGSTDDCRLFTTTFPGTPLVAFLETDEEFFLEPTFSGLAVPVPTASLDDPQYWRSAIAIERDASYRRNRPTQNQIYQVIPNAANCDGGMITQWAKDEARTALNNIRALHKLAPVAYLNEFDAEVQAASLVQLANNGQSGHFPAASDNCFSQAAADGAGSSNLFFGSADEHPVSYMLGWTHDADNLASVMAAGHRRHILNPSLGYVSYGSTLGYAAQKVFGFGRSTVGTSVAEDFIALPSGAYPYVLVNKSRRNPTPWSFHVVSNDPFAPEFNYFGNAKVSIRDTVTGNSVALTDLYTDSIRYGGLHGIISWLVPDYEYDREYEVTVSGIAMPGGNVRDHTYSVTIVRRDVLDLSEPLEPGDTAQARGLAGAVNNEDDRDATVVSISNSGTYQLNAQTMFSNWALYVEVYDENKNLLISTDAPTSLNLSPGDYTLAVGRCSEQGSCYGWSNLNYTVELR